MKTLFAEALAVLIVLTLLFLGSVDWTIDRKEPVQTTEIVRTEPTVAEPTIEETVEVISREPEPEIWTVTAYCACDICCGKSDGITASGAMVTPYRTVAADPAIAYGTTVWIEGLGERVVEDRGSAIRGKHLDVYMDSHQDALDFGVRELRVEVVE